MDFITQDVIRKNNIAAKRQFKKGYSLPNAPMGEMTFMQTGEGGKKLFTQEMIEKISKLPAGEMMSLADVKAFVQQTVLDVTIAQAEHPTVYQEIYDEIVNSAFPETVKVRDLIGLQAAFGVVHDGESVAMASFKLGKFESVDMQTFAAGYSISKDWVDYNQFWKVDQANRALGIAHNAILDHIHLSPIISASYTGKAITNKVSTGSTNLENVWLTLRSGIQAALKRKSSHGYLLRPTIALCNSATAMDVEAAVNGLLQKGTQLGSLGVIQKVIAYDGWDGEVNGVVHNFAATKDNEVYLIQPKQTFKALVKTDITQLSQRGNILTLSELDVAQFFRRAVVADVTNSVHKVMLA